MSAVKRGKAAASCTANKKVPKSTTKRAKGGPRLSKVTVTTTPIYDPYEDGSGDDYSTTCSFGDDSDEKPMDKLKWRIELAKADVLGTMDYHAEQFLKDTRRSAEKRFDKLYAQISKMYKPK